MYPSNYTPEEIAACDALVERMRGGAQIKALEERARAAAEAFDSTAGPDELWGHLTLSKTDVQGLDMALVLTRVGTHGWAYTAQAYDQLVFRRPRYNRRGL